MMALNVGSRLGHYEVTALIGEGGMGQSSSMGHFTGGYLAWALAGTPVLPTMMSLTTVSVL